MSNLPRKAVRFIRDKGLVAAIFAAVRLIRPQRSAGFGKLGAQLYKKQGIEVGGPSEIFQRRGLLPIYPLAENLDNCNFSNNTLWEGDLVTGRSFVYDKRHSPGHQFIGEASDLSNLVHERYDYILSSHVLEHMADPIRTLLNWQITLQPEGKLVLVLPHKDGTFDHRRPTTPLEHLINDYHNKVSEADTTHLDEILELHDFSRDPGSPNREDFKQRALENEQHRGLHHHAFDGMLVARLLNYCKFRIEYMECALPFHIIAIASTTDVDPSTANAMFFSAKPSFLQESPFASDVRF